MQKSCRCGFMYGDLTDKETIARIEECLESQIHDQFEILLYKKNSELFFPCMKDDFGRLNKMCCTCRENI